jgi:hypothetical protein
VLAQVDILTGGRSVPWQNGNLTFAAREVHPPASPYLPQGCCWWIAESTSQTIDLRKEPCVSASSSRSRSMTTLQQVTSGTTRRRELLRQDYVWPSTRTDWMQELRVAMCTSARSKQVVAPPPLWSVTTFTNDPGTRSAWTSSSNCPLQMGLRRFW